MTTSVDREVAFAMVDSVLSKDMSVHDMILGMEAVEVSSDVTFDNLVRMSRGHRTRKEFEDSLKPGEREYIDSKFEGFDLDGKTNAMTMTVSEAESAGFKYSRMKNGKVRVHILPAAWKTAKSVIGRAIDAGINYDGMGKTAIEKALPSTKPTKSAWMRACDAYGKLFTLWPELNGAQREQILKCLNDRNEECT